MDSDGFLSVYTLPELKLLYKENCVDAADAVWVPAQVTVHKFG